jgi:ATP-binding cassette subfamily C (CFTR/MRP) protein 4
MLIGAIARIGQAVVVGELIQYFSSHATSNTSSSKEGFIWAAILVLCGLVTVFEHHHVFFITWRKGLQLKVAMVAAIYAKATRLGAMGSSSSVSSGQVVNLAGNDADRFLMACLFGPYLWWGPAYTVGVLVAGIMIIGPSFLAGFSLLLIFVPLQFYLSYRFATLRSKVAHITDRRITLVSQAVGGARVMKMSGWETQFEERIEKIRQLESARIQKANRLRALNEAIYFTSSIIMNVVIFVVYVRIQGGTLTPRKVFSCMALINVVQFELMKHFALGVMGVSECSVSVSRIQDFLRSPEIVTPVLPAESTLISEKVQPIISLNGVTCHWKLAASSQTASDVDRNTSNEDSEASSSSDSETAIAISKVSLDLKRGELCCIIGSVGSGKSALILALAGELQCSKGEIIRNYTSLAYAAQDSWIMDGTVRENITFGLEFKEEWYNEVVNACGLLQDFSQFHNGDQTIVGDRGVQCSGGQRARIGLARALYRDADIVLLDDPLSAVDAKVGRLLFYSAIQELCVQRGKCVVLATHQHQFLGSSRCVYMSRGEIAFIGSYADCAAVSNGTITKSLQATSSDRYEDGSVLKSTTAEEDNDDDSPSICNGSPSETVENVDEKELEDKNAHKEQKTTGLVSAKTYLNYMKAMGGVGPVLVNLILFLASQASILIAILAIGYWARMPFNQQTATSTIGVILGLGAIVALLAWIRSVSGFYFTIKASQRLHDNMLSSVLRAKIEFFDTNPVGRILNRFSGDIGIIDDALPQTLFDFFVCLFMVIGGIITAAVVMPYVLIAFPPVLYYFYSARVTFVTTSRELKRIEGVARSPIFAMLGEALQGIGTIRANQSIPFFCKKFENVQNDHTRAFWSFIAASRWLGFRLDLIVWVMLTLVSFLSVFATYGRWFEINPSLLGLALLLVIQLGALFQWCVRQSAEVVTQMVSVERVVDFSSLDSEAALITDEDKKHASWPHQGNIEIDSLTVRYRSGLPPSLLGVNVLIETRQRVGVVGRTGSGEANCLFHFSRLCKNYFLDITSPFVFFFLSYFVV